MGLLKSRRAKKEADQELNRALEIKREEELVRIRADREESDRQVAEILAKRDNAESVLSRYCRKATVSDYSRWLRGYMENGGEPKHTYDYPFSRWDGWWVANEDFELPELYGASSVYVIVPQGVTVTGKLGHNTLYYLKDYTTNGIVPLFSDISF